MVSRLFSHTGVAAMAALLVTANPAAQTTVVAAPRDLLTIEVFSQPALSGKFLVDPDGTFLFPHIGRVKAAGLTPREIAAELTKELAAKVLRSPQVTVELQSAATKKVLVLGEVNRPAVYPFGGELRLLEALLQAGSINAAAGDQVLIIHAENQEPVGAAGADPAKQKDAVQIDLQALMGGSMKENVLLQDGDTIIVKAALFVFITGYVRAPGQYRVPRGATVEQALALAGSVTEQGSNRRIEITRAGEKEPIKVKLSDLVKPGDTIRVLRRIV